MASAAAKKEPGPAAPAVHTPKPSPAKVNIGCKLHVAYFELELCKPATVREEGLQGAKDVVVHHRTGQKHTIRGLAYPAGTVPEGFPDRPTVVAGYAITRDVPGEFWDEWLEQNRLNPIVLNKMVVGFASLDDIKSVGTVDTKGVLSGLQPVQRGKVEGRDTITDARVTRPVEKAIGAIEPGKVG